MPDLDIVCDELTQTFFSLINERPSDYGSKPWLFNIIKLLDKYYTIAKAHDNRKLHIYVFDTTADLLGMDNHSYRKEVWDWIKSKAENASEEQQRAMRITFLELLPEEPISWDLLEDLFNNWWFDEKIKWAVYAAYSDYPDMFREHFNLFRNRQLECGENAIEFNAEEYEAWRSEL